MAYRYIQNKKTDSAEIFLYDDIGERFGGVSANTIRADLQAIGEVKNLTVRMDSAGGEVRVGWNIYNQFREHTAHKTFKIDGWAASISSVIATSGDEIIIADNGRVMMHKPWGLVAGEADDIRAEADLLDSIEEDIIKAYLRRIKRPEEDIRQMMRDTTWLTAHQAVEIGFADEINESTLLAASCADLKKYHYPSPPEAILEIENKLDFPAKRSYNARFATVEKVMLKHKL